MIVLKTVKKFAIALISLVIVFYIYLILSNNSPPDKGLLKTSDGYYFPILNKSDNGTLVVADSSSIRRNGDKATLRYTIFAGGKNESQNHLVQFDCKQQSYRTIEEVWYINDEPYEPKLFRSGDVNVPNSPLEYAMTYACWLPWWKR